jgi:hypothetical protein
MRLPSRRSWLRFTLLGGAAAALVAGAQKYTWAADHNDPVRVQAEGADSAHHGDPAADIADIFAYYTPQAGKPEKIVLALTWRTDPLEEQTFDPSVRYGIHIDNNAGLDIAATKQTPLSLMDPAKVEAEYDIIIWFGKKKNTANEWGVLASGIPGPNGKKLQVVGDVGTTLSPEGDTNVKVMAGLFDDPFFFDLDGFFNSLAGSLGNPKGNPQQPATNGAKPWPAGAPYNGKYSLQRTSATSPSVRTPFGFDNTNDGFGRNNVHAVVIEIPVENVVLEDRNGKHKDLHVWATTDSRPDLDRKGTLLPHADPSNHNTRKSVAGTEVTK